MGTFLARAALLALAGALGCDAAPAPSPAATAPSAASLAPEVLHDEAEIEAYLAAFPKDAYTVHAVPEVGRFWIDHGEDRIKKLIVEGTVHEPHVVEVLADHVRPGSAVIDVGAHVGTLTLEMARLAGPEGRVYAFEPVRKLFRELHHNMALNEASNVVPLRYALGKGPPRVVEMEAVDLARESGANIGRGGDPVELRSLDSFGFRGVSLIKIDVEGFELFVLDGAEETIRRERPVLVVEIMGGHHYEHSPPAIRNQIDVTKLRIRQLGYELAQVGPHDYLAIPHAADG